MILKRRVWTRFWLILVAALLCAVAGHLTAADENAPGEKDFHRGRTLFDQGRYGEAIGAFEKATAQDPKMSLYAQWLGRACGLEAERASLLSKPGLAGRSREALERAVALDPNNVGARSDLAAFYAAAPGFMGGGADKARAQVAEIAKHDPYLGQVRAADLLWDDDHPAEAEKIYSAAVALNSRRAEARTRLGMLYEEDGRYPQSFAQWDAVLAVEPAQPRALYGLGKTAARSGQRLPDGERALRGFLASATPDPENAPPAKAHLLLGQLLAKRGDKAGARAEFRTALRLDPRLKEAQQAMEKAGMRDGG